MGDKIAAVKKAWKNRYEEADEISRRMAIADRREAREAQAKREGRS